MNKEIPRIFDRSPFLWIMFLCLLALANIHLAGCWGPSCKNQEKNFNRNIKSPEDALKGFLFSIKNDCLKLLPHYLTPYSNRKMKSDTNSPLLKGKQVEVFFINAKISAMVKDAENKSVMIASLANSLTNESLQIKILLQDNNTWKVGLYESFE